MCSLVRRATTLARVSQRTRSGRPLPQPSGCVERRAVATGSAAHRTGRQTGIQVVGPWPGRHSSDRNNPFRGSIRTERFPWFIASVDRAADLRPRVRAVGRPRRATHETRWASSAGQSHSPARQVGEVDRQGTRRLTQHGAALCARGGCAAVRAASVATVQAGPVHAVRARARAGCAAEQDPVRACTAARKRTPDCPPPR